MNTRSGIVFTLIICLSFTFAAEKRLPENFRRCSQNDPNISNCLLHNVPDALQKMKEGIPSLNVPLLEPLSVSAIDISSGGGPVNIKQHYGNIKIYGLTSSNLTNYNADLKKFSLITDSYTPMMHFLADYTMDGRILLLPITGKGRCNITMVGLITKHILIGEPITKKNQMHMKIKEYDVQFIPERVYFHFTNLFNGNKALGEQMNRFMNENSMIVFNELKSSYEQSFGLLFKDITNKIFTKVPFDQIFPVDKPNNGDNE